MPRKGNIDRRDTMTDPKYGDKLVSKFINGLMKGGKKSTAEGIVYGAFAIIEKRSKDEPLKVFKTAVENVKPVIEVKSRRVGGSTYQVPVEVRADRRISLAIKWVIKAVRNRGEYTTEERLCNELISASRKEGVAYKKKEDTHRMAEANKAFAHFGW